MQSVPPGSSAVTPQTGAITMSGQEVALRVLYALNPGGPFYRFVLTYLVASAGLTPVYDEENYSNFLKGVDGIFRGVLSGTARVDLAECVALARDNTLPVGDAEESMCCMLANTAFESMAAKDRNGPNAVLQFFRHVRNAASHGNRWHFYRTEPRLPARWRLLTVDHNLKGSANPLHGKKCFFGSMASADLLYLLQDVERLI
jgi:hypothetical protein